MVCPKAPKLRPMVSCYKLYQDLNSLLLCTETLTADTAEKKEVDDKINECKRMIKMTEIQ